MRCRVGEDMVGVERQRAVWMFTTNELFYFKPQKYMAGMSESGCGLYEASIWHCSLIGLRLSHI
jgi:hypothetical protein